MVLGVRLPPEAGSQTPGSQRDDGDDGDQREEQESRDDSVAEHSPGGAAALLSARRAYKK